MYVKYTISRFFFLKSIFKITKKIEVEKTQEQNDQI